MTVTTPTIPADRMRLSALFAHKMRVAQRLGDLYAELRTRALEGADSARLEGEACALVFDLAADRARLASPCVECRCADAGLEPITDCPTCGNTGLVADNACTCVHGDSYRAAPVGRPVSEVR